MAAGGVRRRPAARSRRPASARPRSRCGRSGRTCARRPSSPAADWHEWASESGARAATVHVSAVPVMAGGRPLGFVVLVHDMSFVERREATTRRTFLLLGLRPARAAPRSSSRCVAARALAGGAASNETAAPASRGEPPRTGVRAVPARRARAGRPPGVASARSTGSAACGRRSGCKSTLSRHLHGERVVIVANREPYIHERAPDGAVRVRAPGERPRHGARAGHAGLLGHLDRPRQRLGRPRDGGRARPRARAAGRGVVHAAPGLAHARGGAAATTTASPTRGSGRCATSPTRGPIFRGEDWEHYQRGEPAVRRRGRARRSTADDPIVLVQDYHFALLPRLIRERLPARHDHHLLAHPLAERGALRHLPVARRAPRRACSAAASSASTPSATATTSSTRSTASSRRASTASRTRSCTSGQRDAGAALSDLDRVAERAGCRAPRRSTECRAEVFARAGPARRTRCSASASTGSTTPRASRSGCWPSSGCSSAIPELRGRFTFVQLAAPSRTIIERYRQLDERRRGARRADQRAVRRRRLPARSSCCARTTSRRAVFRFYRAADLCYVSSLHDGMNLVAKEFVAARDDERGVLVLSQFTGAARELTEALIVNPYDLGRGERGAGRGARHAGRGAAGPDARDAGLRRRVQRLPLGRADARRRRARCAAASGCPGASGGRGSSGARVGR